MIYPNRGMKENDFADQSYRFNYLIEILQDLKTSENYKYIQEAENYLYNNKLQISKRAAQIIEVAQKRLENFYENGLYESQDLKPYLGKKIKIICLDKSIDGVFVSFDLENSLYKLNIYSNEQSIKISPLEIIRVEQI